MSEVEVRSYYEFFAGGGMARAGLGPSWACTFANDIDTKKGASYIANWGQGHLKIADVATVNPEDLPGSPSLAWASFPCQDLSLAGSGAGLNGKRSGTFWPFWRLMQKLGKEGRAPSLIVLENVCGALASHGGKDFAAIGTAIAGANYRFGAVVVDAVHFVPQSRPRLFVICVREGIAVPEELRADEPGSLWHPPHLMGAYKRLSALSKDAWVWWQLPTPAKRTSTFLDLIEDEPQGVAWHTAEETSYLLSLMSPINRKKVERAQRMGTRMVGGVYKRTRETEKGKRIQRAEVRFDDVSGCLRTPVGGSSRQTIIMVEGKKVRSRLLSPREAVRLMGLPDSYKLPKNYNEAYHLAGDGVVVPVVRFLTANILEPLLAAAESHEKEAA
ncbi:MAG TPA: DNA cytosine methyltransferase [Terriglobales bacterium]|nr:DNA cytosine methyltransferase [Terriglobales bacterium]